MREGCLHARKPDHWGARQISLKARQWKTFAQRAINSATGRCDVCIINTCGYVDRRQQVALGNQRAGDASGAVIADAAVLPN